MEFTLFDLATLLEVRRNVEVMPRFWLSFFRRQVNFETKYIDFEKVSRRYKRLAPLVSPVAQGRVISTQGSNLQRFAPAYVKPKSVITPDKVLSRQPGENPMQPMSNEAKRRAVIAEETREHKERMENRLEWLAANAVIYGGVTLADEDYPTQYVDFGRDPELTLTLTTDSKWDETGGDPLADLRLMRSKAKDKSGSVIRTVVFGQNAWDAFYTKMGFNDPQSGNLLDTNFRGSETEISRLLDGFEGAEYAGALSGREGMGRIECWVYSGTFEDDEGVAQNLMDPNDVVGLGDFDGVRCFGAILDPKAGYQALDVFMKNWVSEDPGMEYLLSQSAPLMVPGEPNATFRMTVL